MPYCFARSTCQVDYGLLECGDEVTDAEFGPFQIDEGIDHELAGAVIGNLAATVDLNDRDVSGRQQMLAAGIEAERKNRRMFRKPDLVGGIACATVGEFLHVVPKRFIWLHSERSNFDHSIRLCKLVGDHHSATRISSCSVRSR
jgi:hypothetical protein